MFQVNDKVVCVNDSPGKPGTRYSGLRLLKLGEVYAVKAIVANSRGGPPNLALVGFDLGHTECGRWAMGFCSTRFRKVSEVQSENRLRREKRARTA